MKTFKTIFKENETNKLTIRVYALLQLIYGIWIIAKMKLKIDLELSLLISLGRSCYN